MAQFETGEVWVNSANQRWSVVSVHTDGHLSGWVTLGRDGTHILRRQHDTMFWRKVA